MTIIESLDNGLVLIVEQVPLIESAAYDLLIPGGIINDDQDTQGACLLLAELTSRGAGTLNSRQLSEVFDDCGIRHGESASHDKFAYRGSLVGEHLQYALKYVAQMVRNPLLPPEEIDCIRSVLLQEIAAVGDNPARKAMLEMAARYYPAPYGRPSVGTRDGLSAVNIDRLRDLWQRQFRPQGAVLSVAGCVDPAVVRDYAAELFADWEGAAPPPPAFGAQPSGRSYWLPSESAQEQIILAYPSAEFDSEHYYAAKVATGLLSGGMFGRLFLEVREKRGLCYSVYARHTATREYGTVLVYAGTTPERAHETLEVVMRELRQLAGTMTESELARAKANLLSALIIGEESSSARAASNAGDWWIGGRVRPLKEIEEKIRSISIDDIEAYLDSFPPDDAILLTLGPRELTVAVHSE